MADVSVAQSRKPDLRIRLPPIRPDEEILASPAPTPVAPVAVPVLLPPIKNWIERQRVGLKM
jgi:hypothetical protein